ncbi:MAG: 2-phosphoglycolate phosphatase [Oleispira sp.]
MRESALNTSALKIPKALLFDLDGTLMDTAPDFFPTVNTLRKEHNLPPLADDIIRLQVSNGGRALTRLALDMPLIEVTNQESINLNDADTLFFEQQRQRLLDLYIDHIAEKSNLFPGMIELLETCAQYSLPWGIVTNKPRLYTEILLERLADRLPILAHCAVVVCPDDVARTKPFPDPLYLAADTLKIPALDCWYLGDHARDIDAGNAANMFTIATLYGYIAPHDNPENWQADISVNTVEEITQLLTSSLAT